MSLFSSSLINEVKENKGVFALGFGLGFIAGYSTKSLVEKNNAIALKAYDNNIGRPVLESVSAYNDAMFLSGKVATIKQVVDNL